jgi:glycosyltransferase involved in cell wall biosynthesis
VPDPALSAKLGFDGKTVLGFLGSFYAYEGLHLLFEAMPEILAAMPETRLLLVGGGPEDGRLRNLAARLGIADKVVFTGRVPHAEVQRYYALVDVLVYPRVPIRLTDLVTPLKPLEAMAQGKIIVASDVGGHRELIRDGATGNMFRAGNVQDLAATTLRVLRDRGSWPMQRANGRRYVEAERSWPASVAGYEPVYRRLMSRETVAPRSIRAGSFLRS